MGLFGKLGQALGVSSASSESVDIEELMNTAEMEQVDALHEPANMYVKPIAIAAEEEVSQIEEELGKNNIVLLNISELRKRPTTMNNVLSRIKQLIAKCSNECVYLFFV